MNFFGLSISTIEVCKGNKKANVKAIIKFCLMFVKMIK